MSKPLDQNFDFGSATDCGQKRVLTANQDALIILLSPKGRGLPPVMVVADGMGGYQGGEVASQIIIETFSDLYDNQNISFSFEEYCRAGLELARKKMLEKASASPEYSGMGSTIAVACIQENWLLVMNVGDSRIYLVHRGKMTQVSFDHSFVGEAVRAGIIQPEEAMTHPQKNQLTQSVSTRRSEIKPYFGKSRFSRNDILLLCTDGLWSVIEESMIQKTVLESSSQVAADQLIDLANAKGGPDNISVIICK
jgi:PPM family protein phosphatase